MSDAAYGLVQSTLAAWSSFSHGVDPAATARAYWHALQVLTAFAAVTIFISSIDDLFIDLAYWQLAFVGGLKSLFRPPPSRDKLVRAPEKSIAIMVPAWQESAVIATMIANTVNTFDYQRFHIFVGVYANDPETRAEVDRMRQRFPNVHRADVPHGGPTSKADCLNWIVQSILAHEKNLGEAFDIFLMHDAEDVVHPFGLKTVNGFLNGQGMIQLPVLSMNRPFTRLIACHYLDEFAEFHSKDLPVRSVMTGMTPSAGVATAFSRAAILALRAERHDEPFNTGSLTEDYDVAHRLHALGHHSRFVRYFTRTTRYRNAWFRKGQVPYVRTELVATKEFFPDRWRTSVRQKARWMLGISYMGWVQLGWFGDAANRYFLFRDRKALFTAPTGVLAYILLLSQLFYWLAERIDPDLHGLPPLVDQPWLEVLVMINLGFLINRLVHRLWFTGRTHGLGYVWLAPVRMVVANLIGFGAFARSMRIFLGHLITRKPMVWDKTDHAFPAPAEMKLRRMRLGDVLGFWKHIDAVALDEALKEQKRRYRPLGLLLLDRGAVDEQDLAEAFAEQAETEWASFDPLSIEPAVLKRLDVSEAARFAAVPLRLTGDRLEVALGEPLSKTGRAELESRLTAGRDVTRISWTYAPLSDIAFAVRWAWRPEALAAAREATDRMIRQGLIDASGHARLWRETRKTALRLGDLLVRSGALDHAALQKALDAPGVAPLGQRLVAGGVITPEALDQALKAQGPGPADMNSLAVRLGLVDPGKLEPA